MIRYFRSTLDQTLMDKVYDISTDTYTYDRWFDYRNDREEESKESNQSKESKEKYTLVLPPPNITGILHMGHALNLTMHDILIRWKRLNGYDVLWIPGMDHAGIATQSVIEKQLKIGGMTRYDIGRDKLIERIWSWKQDKGDIIKQQIKKVGCLCDWEKERFTMDTQYQESVKTAFIKLHESNLIYRDMKIINWCPHCETSLSDEEVDQVDETSTLYHINYTIDDESITIKTITPETIFADGGLRTNNILYSNKSAINCMTGQCLPIIIDDTMQTLTNMERIVPSHNEYDYNLAKIHKLYTCEVIDNTGKIYNTNTEYDGQHYLHCRKELGKKFKTEKCKVKVNKCYRCANPVISRLSTQWFVSMKTLAELAIQKSSDIKFYPSHYEKVYLHWLNNIRDWCISRQIWWGHRIPAFYCKACNHCMVMSNAPNKCIKCDSLEIYQDTDVLDTWFSSWLWYCITDRPIDVIISGHDILFFWITRMIIASLFFDNKLPFDNIYLHGIIRDKTGSKMSKSKGNAIDPIDIINTHGADALRYTLISSSPIGTDTKLKLEAFNGGKTFRTKIWNAARYILHRNIDMTCQNNTNINSWILSRLNSVIDQINTSLHNHNFHEYARIIYDFVWNDFCNFYLEITKFYSDNSTNITLKDTFLNILKLLHPLMPFVTDKIWALFNMQVTILNSSWPISNVSAICHVLDSNIEIVRAFITHLRNVKPTHICINNTSFDTEIDYICKITRTTYSSELYTRRDTLSYTFNNVTIFYI